MKIQNILLLILTISLTNTSWASVPKANEKDKLIEELTGQKSANKAAVGASKSPQASANSSAAKTVKPQDKTSLSRLHLNAGFQAFTKKDYIKALKHYNTILIKHYNTPEVKSAYLAKAKLYQEMGLIEQAQLNVKLANEFEKKIQIKK